MSKARGELIEVIGYINESAWRSDNGCFHLLQNIMDRLTENNYLGNFAKIVKVYRDRDLESKLIAFTDRYYIELTVYKIVEQLTSGIQSSDITYHEYYNNIVTELLKK